VAALIEDSDNGRLRRPAFQFKGKGVRPLLEALGVGVVDHQGWGRIDAAERQGLTRHTASPSNPVSAFEKSVAEGPHMVG